jgi:hypothetical protein
VKVNAVKKIIIEDYDATQRTLVQRLALTLNTFLDQVSSAINGNLTLKENFKGKVYKLDLPAGTSTITVGWSLNEKPTAVLLGALTKADTTAPSAAFSMSWRYENKTIVVTFQGLDGSTAHTTTIVAQV